jgi:hypothetical protein
MPEIRVLGWPVRAVRWIVREALGARAVLSEYLGPERDVVQRTEGRINMKHNSKLTIVTPTATAESS